MGGTILAKKSNKVEKWEIEGWVRTLREAEAIKNDPKKMKLLQPFLKKEIKAIEDLRELANNYQSDDMMDEEEGD